MRPIKHINDVQRRRKNVFPTKLIFRNKDVLGVIMHSSTSSQSSFNNIVYGFVASNSFTLPSVEYTKSCIISNVLINPSSCALIFSFLFRPSALSPRTTHTVDERERTEKRNVLIRQTLCVEKKK